MSNVKEWATWIAKQVYIHKLTNEQILNSAQHHWGEISKLFFLEEIEKVRNHPEVYKHMHDG